MVDLLKLVPTVYLAINNHHAVFSSGERLGKVEIYCPVTNRFLIFRPISLQSNLSAGALGRSSCLQGLATQALSSPEASSCEMAFLSETEM